MTTTRSHWLAYGFLIVAIVAGLTTRLYRLTSNPQGVHPDEILYGYEGWSIRDTGCDYRQTGCPPLYLKGYSTLWDNRTSVLYPYIYSVLFRFLPMTLLTIRMLSVILGMGVVILTFIFGRLLWPHRPVVAGLGAVFVALSPVAISWSRLGHDPITTPFFSLVIAISVLLTRRHSWWWLVAGVTLAIGFYSYQPFKLVGPSVFLLSWWYVQPKWTRQQWTWFFSAAAIGAALTTPFLLNQLKNWSVVQRQFNSMILFRFDNGWIHVFKNIVVYPWTMINNPGLFVQIVLPAAAVGWVVLFRSDRRRALFLLGWILAAWMTVFITLWQTSGNEMQSRGLGYLGPLELLAALGLSFFVARLWRWRGTVRKQVALGVIIILIVGQMLAGALMNRAWEQFCCFVLGGMEQAAAFVQQPQYADRPVVINYFHFMQGVNTLWNFKVDPRITQSASTEWSRTTPGDPTETQYPSKFGRYTLCTIDECYQPGDGALYIVYEGQLPDLPVLATFTLHFYRQSFTWKIVDNAPRPK